MVYYYYQLKVVIAPSRHTIHHLSTLLRTVTLLIFVIFIFINSCDFSHSRELEAPSLCSAMAVVRVGGFIWRLSSHLAPNCGERQGKNGTFYAYVRKIFMKNAN